VSIGSACQDLVSIDADSAAIDPEAERLPLQVQAELERIPLGRQVWIDDEALSCGPHARKAERQRLPEAAHRREMYPASGRPGQVVEVEPRCEAERLEGGSIPTRAREQRCVNGGRE
jgi:hypothetical protein